MVTQENSDALFKAVADPTRRAILEALKLEPLAVQSLAERFSTMSRPAISKHLRILREAGLVDEDQQGRQRYYHLRPGSLGELESWLRSLRASEPESVAPAKSGRASPGRRRPTESTKSTVWRVW